MVLEHLKSVLKHESKYLAFQIFKPQDSALYLGPYYAFHLSKFVMLTMLTALYKRSDLPHG